MQAISAKICDHQHERTQPQSSTQATVFNSDRTYFSRLPSLMIKGVSCVCISPLTKCQHINSPVVLESKTGHHIMMKELIHQEELTVLNMCAKT